MKNQTFYLNNFNFSKKRLYITINDPHQAIQMYKRIKNYDNMIRLIKEFHPDMVSETYIHLAKVIHYFLKKNFKIKLISYENEIRN